MPLSGFSQHDLLLFPDPQQMADETGTFLYKIIRKQVKEFDSLARKKPGERRTGEVIVEPSVEPGKLADPPTRSDYLQILEGGARQRRHPLAAFRRRGRLIYHRFLPVS
jgi:hypothetical protein